MKEAFLSDVIRGARERRGLSQSGLGRAIGRSQSAVANFESGQTAVTDRTLELVADGLKVTVRRLIREQLDAEEAVAKSAEPVPTA